MMIDPKQLSGLTPQELAKVKTDATNAFKGIAPLPRDLGRMPPEADLPGMKRNA